MILDAAALWLFGPVLASRAERRFIVRVVLQQRERARLPASSLSRRSRPAPGCCGGSESRRGFHPHRRPLRRGSDCQKSLHTPGSDRVRGRDRGGPFFGGEYTSSDTGLIYLRARVYDPATGQFLSVDPLAGITGERYGYAGENPLSYSDPTGLSILGIKPPSWVEKGIEGLAGWGDTLTFGATKWAREQLGDENVNTCSGAYKAGGYAGLATAAIIPGEGEAEIGAQGLSLSAKIARQMEARGWTEESIQEAINSGEQVRAVNKATGNPATRYINPTTGQSVVIDDVTHEVIHVGGAGFKYGSGSGDLP